MSFRITSIARWLVPDAGHTPSNQTVVEQPAETPLDQALRRLEAFIGNLEKQKADAEERAAVPDDVPRFVSGDLR